MESPVRLSLYTDFSLRMLVYLAAAPAGVPVSTSRIAEQFKVSAHHMRKVAQGLRRLGYVESVGGRRGGVRLAIASATLSVGQVVEAVEGIGSLVDCHRGPCSLHGACALQGALSRAERRFIEDLKQYSIADVVRGPTLVRLEHLMRAA